MFHFTLLNGGCQIVLYMYSYYKLTQLLFLLTSDNLSYVLLERNRCRVLSIA